jgi:hypothetical protein
MESCGVGGEETEIADESCILAKLAVAAFFATKSAFLSVSLACLPADLCFRLDLVMVNRISTSSS